MTSRRHKKAGAFAVAVVLTLVLGACAGEEKTASQGIVPGGAGTGRAETGPSETGPAETGPAARPGSAQTEEWLPKGAVPSTPREGEIVADFSKIRVGSVYVYADGRVIWFTHSEQILNEQRLTPKGVDLVLSGEVPARRFLNQSSGSLRPAEVFDGVAGVWAAPRIGTYVAPRWAICYADKDTNGLVDPSGVADWLLPEEAEALLRGNEGTYDHVAGSGGNMRPSTCFELAIDEARALDDILSNATRGLDFLRHAAFGREVIGRGELKFVPTGRMGRRWNGQPSVIFTPLLPQGEWIDGTGNAS